MQEQVIFCGIQILMDKGYNYTVDFLREEIQQNVTWSKGNYTEYQLGYTAVANTLGNTDDDM